MALSKEQRTILESSLPDEFGYIRDAAEISVEVKLRAIDAIFLPAADAIETTLAEDLDALRQAEILETVKRLHVIVIHPCPQNRTISASAGMAEHVPAGHVGWWDEAHEFLTEPQGLLGLTGWAEQNPNLLVEPVTKQDVIDFMIEVATKIKYQINNPAEKEQAESRDLALEHMYEKFQQAIVTAGFRLTPDLEQKIPAVLRPAISDGKIPVAVLLAETMTRRDVIQHYAPLAELFNQDVLKFADYHALTLDNKEIILLFAALKDASPHFIARLPGALNKMAPPVSAAFLETITDPNNYWLFKDNAEKRALLLFFLDVAPDKKAYIESRTIQQYSTLGGLFDQDVITYEQYCALSLAKKKLFKFFLLGEEGFQSNDDKKFIITLYHQILGETRNNIIAGVIDSFKNIDYRDPAALVEEIKTSYFQKSSENLLEIASTKFDEKVRDECEMLDELMVEVFKRFTSAEGTYADPKIVAQQPVRLSNLLLSSTLLAQADKSGYQLKRILINTMIENCKAENNVKKDRRQRGENSSYLLGGQVLQYCRKNHVVEKIKSHIDIFNPQEVAFLATLYPDQVQIIIEGSVISQLKINGFYIDRVSSQQHFMQLIDKVPDAGDASDTKNGLIQNAILHALALPNPPLDFLLNTDLLSKMSKENFQLLFKNETVLTGLLATDSLQKLSNPQIYVLFDYVDANKKTALKGQPRLEPVTQHFAQWRRGITRWSEIIEMMKDCIFKNTTSTLNPGETKGGNLLSLARAGDAIKLLSADAAERTRINGQAYSADLLARYNQDVTIGSKVKQYADERVQRVTAEPEESRESSERSSAGMIEMQRLTV